MRIKRVYIRKYKNIRNQELTFNEGANNLALIGVNGSGKSNWLEAISLIFSNHYGEAARFSYDFEYEMDGSQYQILYTFNDSGEEGTTTFKRGGTAIKKADVFFPRVIACYSGENTRLWNRAYREYFNAFFRKAIQNEIETPEMLYVDKRFWNIALITLLCSEDAGVRDFLKKHFGLENYDNVSVEIKLLRENIEKFKTNNVVTLLNRFDNGEETCTMLMPEFSSIDLGHQGNLDFCRKMFYYLFIASLPIANEENPINRAIESIQVCVDNVSTNSFSEGEQKMILVKCLTALIGDENTLLVLDEPDAHVHVANKIDIAQTITDFQGQTILTSHSPVVANALESGNIRYLDNGVVNNSDKLTAISQVSGNRISLIDGAFILSTKKLVITEGHYDIDYIRTAANKLSADDSKYSKLNRLAYVFSGSADNTKEYFKKVIKPIIDQMDKVLFIFDFDAGEGKQANGQNGYKAVEELKAQHPGKLECIYYSNDYSAEPSTFYVEDYFPSDCYPEIKTKLDDITTPPYYKELMICKPFAKQIKKRIEQDYTGFSKDKFVLFKPLLEKLLDIFGLNV